MQIILMLFIAAAVLIPLRIYQAKGGSAAKQDYERSFSELDKTGRTVVWASWRQTVKLDLEGFEYRGQRIYWLDVSRPLMVDIVSKHNHAIVYYCKTKNVNLGKRRRVCQHEERIY